MHKRLAIVLLVLTSSAVGCGVREQGPIDPSQVKPADPEVVRKGMEQSMQHLPKGAKIPPGVMPGSKK